MGGNKCKGLKIRTYRVKPSSFLLCFSPVFCHTHTEYLTSNTSGHQVCGVLFPTLSNSLWHQLGALQLYWNLTLFAWREHQISQAQGSVPQDSPSLLQLPVTNSRSPGHPQLLSIWLQIGGSHDLSWGLSNFLEWLIELRDLVTLTGILKDMIKATDEQSEQEMHRVRSGRVAKYRGFCPHRVGYHFSGVVCSPTWKLLGPLLLGLYGGFLR